MNVHPSSELNMSNKANIAVTSGLMKGKSFLSMSMMLSLSDGWLDAMLPAGHEPDMQSAASGHKAVEV